MDDNKPDELVPVEQESEEKGEQKEEGELKEVGKEKEEDEKEVKVGAEEIVNEEKKDEEKMKEIQEEKPGMFTAAKDRPNSSGEEGDEQRVPVEEPEVQIKEIPPMSGTPPREQRAKKAQRTKRANVSSTQNPTKANPKSTKQQKVTSTAMSNDHSGDVCDGSEEEEEEELEEGEGGDELAKVIQGIVNTMERVFRLILCCCGFVCRLVAGIFGAVRRGLGVLFGAAMFAGVAYVIGTYVMTPVSEYDVMGFEARLKFLLRYQVWPTLPVFLAAVAGMVRRDNEVHQTYGRECFEQALMCLFNLLLLATHLEPCWLLGTGACVITATVFSLLHWFCLVYTKSRSSVFSFPGFLLNFGVMAFNLYVIFGQNLGYVPMSIEPEVHKMITGSQGASGAISYWNHVTMCHLVEQMFCKP